MTDQALGNDLAYLKLHAIQEHYLALANEAIAKQRSPIDYLAELIELEVHQRQDRALQRRIKAARFPTVKTLETFQWDWPAKIDRLKVQHLFRLDFVSTHSNAIFIGGVDLVA